MQDYPARSADPRDLLRAEAQAKAGLGLVARIAGVDIPREKRVDVSLRYIFGIGETTAKEVLEQARVDGAVRVRDLTEPQIAKIREIIDRGFTVEGDLRREIALNIKRLQEIGSYRGLRHRKGLPVRGQ